MSACVCERPIEGTDPRRKGTCRSCGLSLSKAAPVPLFLRCLRCGHRFEPEAEGRVGLYFDRGGEGVGKLRTQEVVDLCGGCGEVLRSFIGMRPDAIYR